MANETRKIPIAHRKRARDLLVQALYQWNLSGTEPKQVEAEFRADNGKKTDWDFFHHALSYISEHTAELGALLQLHSLLANNNRLLNIAETLSEIGSLRVLVIHDNPELSGPIPLRFANLQLETFSYYNTQLCEPADSVFQAWLAQIPFVSRTFLSCPT